MIKRALIGMGVVACFMCLVFGWKPLYGYFKTSTHIFKKSVENNIPFEVEVSRLEHMVDDLDQVIRKHEKILLEREVDHEMIEEEVEKRKENLEEQKDELSQARDLLETKETSFAIGSRVYSRQLVQKDAMARLEKFENDQKMLKIRTKTAQTLANALVQARQQLKSMQSKRQEYVEMPQVLRANHLQLEAKKQLAATVQGLGMPNIESEFGSVEGLFNRLNKRLKVESELLDRQPQEIAFEVKYSESNTRQKDVLNRLNDVLDNDLENSDEKQIPLEIPFEIALEDVRYNNPEAISSKRN